MADIYTPPPDTSYLLTESFYSPADGGDVWAVAFSTGSGSFVTAALTLIITFIFLTIWDIIAVTALLSVRDNPSRRREAAMVTMSNANDPLFACSQMANYVRCIIFKHRSDPPSSSLKEGEAAPDGEKAAGSWDTAYGVIFCLVAFVVFGGSTALGVVGPSLVDIGTTAPVRPSQARYPDVVPNAPAMSLARFGLLAPAAMRALGSVEAAEVTLRSRVNIIQDMTTLGTDPGSGESIYGLRYTYSLSGVELGLRYGADLSLAVSGSCQTEYGWAVKSGNLSDDADVYHLWNRESARVLVPIGDRDIRYAPRASFQPHPDMDGRQGPNYEFAVVVSSARRTSITQGSDPWYATEPRKTPDSRFNATHWMKRYRPVLSCKQQDTWTHRGQPLNSIRDLVKAPGLRLAAAIVKVLELAFTTPVVLNLGNASGDSALRSRTTSPNGVIDAKESTMYADMERLLLAAFVASRSTFTDAAMFPSFGQYPNIFAAGTADPEPGAAGFVVSSPGIQTFSLAGLIILPLLLVFLMLVRAVLGLVIKLKLKSAVPRGDDAASPTKWARPYSLAAPSLLRAIYEGRSGEGRDDWHCEDPVAMPGTSSSGLTLCKTRHCKAHFKAPEECPATCPLSEAFTAMKPEQKKQAEECPRCTGHLPSKKPKVEDKSGASLVAKDAASANS